MKRILIGICLLFIMLSAQSQTTKLKELQNDSIFLSDVASLLSPKETAPSKDSLKALAMSDHWTNKSFNPYKDVQLEYPFKITFEDSTFASPVKRRKVVTSRYGWRWGKPHRGIDIDLVTGEKVMAMFDGKVRYVRYVMGHGLTVVIRHNNGLETIYSHLSRQLVKPNEMVKKGQVIGKGGTTGNTIGSHLHLTISYKGVFLHPEYFFIFDETNRVRNKEVWVTRKWATPYLHNARRKSNIEVATTYDEALESQKTQKKIYVVRRGDTLSKISHKYNISISSLCRTNSIRRNSVLRVGQKLIVSP